MTYHDISYLCLHYETLCVLESLFSHYNVIKTTIRPSLITDTIKNDLYIKVNIPTLSEFDKVGHKRVNKFKLSG